MRGLCPRGCLKMLAWWTGNNSQYLVLSGQLKELRTPFPFRLSRSSMHTVFLLLPSPYTFVKIFLPKIQATLYILFWLSLWEEIHEEGKGKPHKSCFNGQTGTEIKYWHHHNEGGSTFLAPDFPDSFFQVHNKIISWQFNGTSMGVHKFRSEQLYPTQSQRS